MSGLPALALRALVGLNQPAPIVAVVVSGGEEIGWPVTVEGWVAAPGEVRATVVFGPSARPFTVDRVRLYHGGEVLTDLDPTAPIVVPAGAVYEHEVILGGTDTI